MRPSAFSLTNPGPLRLYSTAELLKLPPPEWLIDKIMPERGLIALYGQPGVGKSFVALDFAMSIGTNTPWHGRAVKGGPVLYIAAEGGTGMGKRSRAWLIDKALPDTQAAVVWLLESVPVYGDSDHIEQVMKKVTDEVQIQPKLVVIDTLARCFDGNENEQEDMGRFVAGADRFRNEFDAAVIVVHHTRLDGDRERGNTAFRGAADSMLSITKKKNKQGRLGLWLECTKQKDAEEFDPIELIRRDVPAANSQVIKLYGQLVSPAAAARAKLDTVAALVQANPRITYTQLVAASVSTGIPEATAKRKIGELRDKGEIIKENGGFVLGSITFDADENSDTTTN